MPAEVAAPIEPAPPPVAASEAESPEPTDHAGPTDPPVADDAAVEAKTAGKDGKPTHKTARPKQVRQANLSPLYRALRSGRPIEGRIERVIKGGYEIKLNKVRAFCPHSQICSSLSHPAGNRTIT